MYSGGGYRLRSYNSRVKVLRVTITPIRFVFIYKLYNKFIKKSNLISIYSLAATPKFGLAATKKSEFVKNPLNIKTTTFSFITEDTTSR